MEKDVIAQLGRLCACET